MKKITKIITLSTLILSSFFINTTASADSLDQTLLGTGCVLTVGNYASSKITFTAADLAKEHGTIPAGTQITHTVNFNYDFGVTDTACIGAKVSINLEAPTFPANSSINFNTLELVGGLNNAVLIMNSSGTLSLTLTMTAKTGLGLASPFTYSVPFTINADISS